MITKEAVEYAILQGGHNSYAITESNGRMPIGILTSNYPATSEEHGLGMLVDKNLETYFEANISTGLYISWEGPYAIPIQSTEYGLDAGDCGMNGMTFHVATNGTDWNGLGWSHGFSHRGTSRLGSSVAKCKKRFYRLIVNTNHGGPAIRVSEFGVTVDTDVEYE